MLIRQAAPQDGGIVADIYAAARAVALPNVRWAHAEPEIRTWVIGTMVPRGGVWVAEQSKRVAGFMDVADGWLNHLYLLPAVWRQGIGRRLLDRAKALQPTGL